MDRLNEAIEVCFSIKMTRTLGDAPARLMARAGAGGGCQHDSPGLGRRRAITQTGQQQ